MIEQVIFLSICVKILSIRNVFGIMYRGIISRQENGCRTVSPIDSCHNIFFSTNFFPLNAHTW